MNEFDKISIAEMSKQDMLMIIEALDFTGKNANENAFLNLKDSIIKELSVLYGGNEEDFINYLRKK
ncbi:hypothetical protein [Dethiothermospora halolimnae]|uniref:hypothetical protein n=1 Tax=Dethiothermospora halolimnae TaxID=3114390 RepID=UPI003CCB859D